MAVPAVSKTPRPPRLRPRRPLQSQLPPLRRQRRSRPLWRPRPSLPLCRRPSPPLQGLRPLPLAPRARRTPPTSTCAFSSSSLSWRGSNGSALPEGALWRARPTGDHGAGKCEGPARPSRTRRPPVRRRETGRAVGVGGPPDRSSPSPLNRGGLRSRRQSAAVLGVCSASVGALRRARRSAGVAERASGDPHAESRGRFCRPRAERASGSRRALPAECGNPPERLTALRYALCVILAS